MDQTLKNWILPELDEIRALRRRLHRIPELSGNEVETGAAVREFLRDLPIVWEPPRLGTDVVGVLRGGRGEGDTVALRADLDALPITETERPGGSVHPGLMHACGHDGHSAMLAGAARVLARHCEAFRGRVRLIWQPGEEVTALGRKLVDSGVLGDPPPVLVAALHGWPGFPVGTVVSKPGAVMAACVDFFVTVHGHGGHASAPEAGADAVLMAAQLVVALQSVVSRTVAPQDAVVLSVCTVHGGNHPNALPAAVELSGTLRYFDPAAGERVLTAVRRIADGVAAAGGGRIELRFQNLYAPSINHPEAVAAARRAAARGARGWQEAEQAKLASEDFSFYLQQAPGVLAWLGMGESWPALHAAEYEFNDEALADGVGYFVALVLDALR